jgi:hypothetical protein
MLQRCLLTLIVGVLCTFQIQTSTAASNETIEHIVIIWLKQPGNIHAQDTVIKASQALKSIPGVISLRSGKSVPSQRKIVDSSYDVALIISLTNKVALDAYLVHPVHRKLLEEIMKPLVDRIRVYDAR